jgi:AraC family transcriptional activator of pobA
MVRSGAARRIPTYFLYGEAPRPALGAMLHVETIEARSTRHQWKIDPHMHQLLHQLMFVLRGTGVTLLDGVQAQYRPPALILVPARTVHGFAFEPGTTGHVVSISEELLHDMGQREPGITALFARPQVLELQGSGLRSTDLALSVRMLAREFPVADSGHRLALNGWLEVLLGNVLRFAQRRSSCTDPVVGQERRLLEQYFALIERRFRSSQKVDEYATALHVSPSRLRRVCLALTGRSPMQLVHARILLEAKRLLHYTDRAVHVIATELGFEDAAYFTRFFTRRAGASPRVFRQRGPESISPQEPAAG